jgi:GNAT superfamily N-acetyltransferase
MLDCGTSRDRAGDMIRIRRTIGDEKALIDLQRACLPGDLPLRPPTVKYWWLALDDDGAAVGFAGMNPVLSWPGAFYLCRAGVLPSARGQGLQRRLINARIAHARRLGGTVAISDTTARNFPSSRNLIAAGFRPYWPAIPWALPESSYWNRTI